MRCSVAPAAAAAVERAETARVPAAHAFSSARNSGEMNSESGGVWS